MYTERDELIRDVERIIEKVLPTHTRDGQTIVEFQEFNEDGDTVLAAINEAPRPAITMFLAVTGLSTGDVENTLGFSSTYDIADRGTGLSHKDDRAQKLAPYLTERLTVNLNAESVIQETTLRWTVDHRRHYRKDFEAEVQTFMKNNGIPLLPDTEVQGSPDIAVPENNDEMAIVGEIRSSNKQDLGTRVREFQSEVRDLASLHPDAKIVIVMEFPEEIPEERYNSIKTDFQENVGEHLTAIYTENELAELVVDCQSWSPQLQKPIQAY
jgi:hypothetical protein